MRGFLERMQWKMTAWMEGRYGADDLSRALTIIGIVLVLLSIVPGLDLLWIAAVVVLALSIVRTLSRNVCKREAENKAWLRLIERPKSAASLARKAWTNRATTKYFRCKGCGTTLSIPKGKGKLRVTCPKCGWKAEKRS